MYAADYETRTERKKKMQRRPGRAAHEMSVADSESADLSNVALCIFGCS